MDNEQTNKSDTPGTEPNKPVESDKQPASLYDKTEAIVQRQEAANKKTEELLGRQETLHANERLAGTAGGHIEPKVETEDEKWEKGAKERYEGTGMSPVEGDDGN